MSAAEKAAGPVTPQELEDVALRVAQIASTVDIIGCGCGAGDMAAVQNALGLVTACLEHCARDLSELHRRYEGERP